MGKKAVNDEGLEIRQLEALKLRLQGRSYRAIAAIQGIATSTAYDVRAAMAPTERAATADEVRRLELARLDAILTSLWPLTAPDQGLPDEGAVAQALKVIQIRAKILGIEAPVKVEVEGALRVVLELDGDDVAPLETSNDASERAEVDA